MRAHYRRGSHDTVEMPGLFWLRSAPNHWPFFLTLIRRQAWLGASTVAPFDGVGNHLGAVAV